MGYYLISDAHSKNFEYIYVEQLDELIYHIKGDIENAIVIKGSKDGEPFLLKDSKEYKLLCKEKFRNGRKAEEKFFKLAKENKFIVQQIPQDNESFENYVIDDSFSIKRADFEIKNCGNIEVDVKCLTIYNNNKKPHFYIRYKELMDLERLNIQTNRRTVLVIFNQANIDRSDEFFTIELHTILKHNNKSVQYSEEKKCYIVPVSLTTPGFDLLDTYRIIPN